MYIVKIIVHKSISESFKNQCLFFKKENCLSICFSSHWSNNIHLEVLFLKNNYLQVAIKNTMVGVTFLLLEAPSDKSGISMASGIEVILF